MMTRRASQATRIPDDVLEFLQGYPYHRSNPKFRANLDFYLNRIPMQPEGLKYEEFMDIYHSDYPELERNHGYIQWLFPIPEKGLNFRSQPLQEHELQKMSKDDEIIERIFRSYIMMLAFYGIRLDDKDDRPELTGDAQERLQNLSDHPHNLLRITRILKCLALFGPLRRFGAPLILFFTALHSDGYINFSPARMHGQSLERWWSNCIVDNEERRQVKSIVMTRGGFGKGLWGINDFNLWYGHTDDIEADNENQEEETVVHQSSDHDGYQTQIIQLEQKQTGNSEEQSGQKDMGKQEEKEEKIEEKEEQQELPELKLAQDDPPIRSEEEAITVKDELEKKDGLHYKEEDEVSQAADWMRKEDLPRSENIPPQTTTLLKENEKQVKEKKEMLQVDLQDEEVGVDTGETSLKSSSGSASSDEQKREDNRF